MTATIKPAPSTNQRLRLHELMPVLRGRCVSSVATNATSLGHSLFLVKDYGRGTFTDLQRAAPCGNLHEILT